mmetsp:Transcript_8950/g.14978  ORF Transcript_8950/g.14978 Transcript_8950/m.14978 type:complete len:308 (-) Transcript_8950:323-1246(-)
MYTSSSSRRLPTSLVTPQQLRHQPVVVSAVRNAPAAAAAAAGLLPLSAPPWPAWTRNAGGVCVAQEGADPKEPYLDALVQAFIAGGEHPFLYDNVYDLLKVMDYLVAREDVDAARIGATGVSLGGMHAWLLAFADPRVACCAPAIGVQWFDWAVRHDKWQGRVDSIKPVFEVAAAQEGKAAVDGAAVRAVWERLVPGLCEAFDAPRSLAALAPRPLLALQGAKDLRCPIEGVREAWVGVRRAYAAHGKEAADRCELHVERGAGHEVTPAMWRRAEEFFDEHLLGPPPPAAAAAVAEGDAMASSASRL